MFNDKNNNSMEEQEKASKKRTKSERESTPKKHKTSFTKYHFKVSDPVKVAVEQREKDFSSYTSRHHYHSDAEENSDSDDSHSDTERLKDKGLLHLCRVILAEKAYQQDADYSEGKKKGRSYTFMYHNVSFAVRLDKVKDKFYPRVSANGNSDKTTLELSALLDNKSDNYIQAFLDAVQGNEPKPNADADYTEAFKEGLEARLTVLISDVLDYPGNSVVTEQLLANATKENYKQLFLGDQHEGSYGALPSQNINTKVEGNQQRVVPYQNIGKLIKEGSLKITDALSNVPTLRKLRSVIDTWGNDKISITNQNQNETVMGTTFSRFVKERHKATKHEDIKANAPEYHIISEEEDSDDEISKVKNMTPEQRQKRIKELEAAEQAIAKKKAAFNQATALTTDSSSTTITPTAIKSPKFFKESKNPPTSTESSTTKLIDTGSNTNLDLRGK